MYCTEAEVKLILMNIALNVGEETPLVFVAFRSQDKNSLQRIVTFCIQTSEGNETLINAIVKNSTEDEDRQIKFIKSDINIQGGSLQVDYLFVEAKINPKI